MSLTKYAEFKVLDAFEVPKSVGHQRLARLRRQVAHRHQFEFNPRPGYIYVRSRAISSRCNDNFDEFPASEIKQAYRSFIGKPVFVNHHNADHRRARGVIIDAALHEDTNPDGTEDTWAEVLMEVDAVRFPVLAREVMAGNIARTSMGTDVEYSVCTACGNKAYTPADYCQHIPKLKGMKIRRALASGGTEEVLVAERCYGLRFFENSLLVEDPADPTAFTLGSPEGTPETLAMFASKGGISASAARAVIDEGESIVRAAARTEGYSNRRDIEDELSGRKPHGEQAPTPKRPSNAVEQEPEGTRTFPTLKPGEEKPWYWGLGNPDRATSAPKPPKHRIKGSAVEALLRSEAAVEVPEGYVFVRFTSHRVRENFSRRVSNAEEAIDLVSFEAEPITAIPQSALDEFLAIGGNSARGLKVFKRPPDLSKYRKPMFGSRHEAYGETKAPAKVDTMRAENCPVCGDDEGFSGERCSVCGYTEPPSQFRDPDLTKAREQDLRQEQTDQQGMGPAGPEGEAPAEDLQCTNCGEVFSAEGEPEAGTDPSEPEETEEPEPEHPDDTEDPDSETADQPDDLSDLADAKDEDLFDDESDDEAEEDDEVEDPALHDPAKGEGRITAEPEGEPALDEAVEANQTCPICGEGTLVPTAAQPTGEPEAHEVGTDPTKAKETVAMNQPNPAQQRRNRVIAAIREQQGLIERQARKIAEQDGQITALTEGLATLAVAAGVGTHPKFARLVRQAGIKVAADDTNNSPSGAPATSTEEAKKPDSTDNVENIGAAPGAANKGVTPEGVTDVNNSDVTVNPPVLDNLQDPTAPTSGTDAVDPKASDQGANRVTVGNPSQETFDGPGSGGWKSSAKEDERERFTASVRLARLRVQAGIEQGEDLALGQTIFDSEASLGEITAQIDALSAVAAKQAQPGRQASRHLVPQSAQRGAGVQPLRQPSMQATATSEGRGEDEWMIGSLDD